MSVVDMHAPVPAPERAVVGLCHRLNDQLASVEAYLYLMERGKQIENAHAALRTHLDHVAGITRQIRSLCRDQQTELSPIGIGTLFDAANDIMAAYPDGTVHFLVDEEDRGRVLRSDWASTLRASLDAGAWLLADTAEPTRVSVAAELAEDGSTSAIRLTASEDDAPEREHPPCSSGYPIVRSEQVGPRALRLVVGS